MVTLWDKLQFWKSPKKLELNKDYEIYHYPDSDLSGIRILTGKYREVVFYYGLVKFSELGDLGRLSFESKITNTGNFTEEDLQKDDEFVTMLGDILTEMIINETTRDNNSEESDFQ